MGDEYLAKQIHKRRYDCRRMHVEEWRNTAVELRVLATALSNIEVQEKACRLADEIRSAC